MPAAQIAAVTNAKRPLLPQHVYQSHGLGSPPIRFPSQHREPTNDNVESAEQQPLLPPPASFPHHERLPGIPKLTRECLISEIQCYGKYILAVLLTFGLGGIMLALYLTGYFSK